MLLQAGGIAFTYDMVTIIIAVVVIALLSKLMLDWVIKNFFAEYPDDTRESIRLIATVLVAYVCLSLIVYVLTKEALFLLVLLGFVIIVILYLSKDFARDFITRISLLTVKAFSIGDYIEVAEQRGRVLKIGSLYTMLRKDDNSVVCIPNDTIVKSMIVNYTRADYIKLQESILVIVPEQEVSKVYTRISEELDIFGYKRAKILHTKVPEGVRFAVTVNLEDAASISNDTANLHKALNIVKGEFVSD